MNPSFLSVFAEELLPQIVGMSVAGLILWFLTRNRSPALFVDASDFPELAGLPEEERKLLV